MAIFLPMPFNFRQLVSSSSFLRERNLTMIGLPQSWPVDLFPTLCDSSICDVRLGHWNPDHVGEDLAALSDGNGSRLWLVGSGFRDVVDPDIPLVAVLLGVILPSLEGVSPFPLLVQLVQQVATCLFHSGDPASLSLSPSLSTFVSHSSKLFSSERWW